MGAGPAYLLILIAAGTAVPAADTQPRFHQLVQKARAAEKSKDYAKAEQVYREIVELKPEDPIALQNLGLACYLQAKFAEAVPFLENAVRLGPELFGAHLYLGISYYRTNQFPKALPALEKARKLSPKDFISRYWLGASHLAMKSFPDAISELESAVEISPKDQEGLYLLARAYAEYSADLLDRLLRVAPDSVAAHRLRAEDALDEGMPRPAVAELEKAIAMRPGDPGLQQLLQAAQKAADTEETSAAPMIVRPAVELSRERLASLSHDHPDDPDILYVLGKTYEARSAELGSKLFELYPDSYRVRVMRGEAYEKSEEQDFEKALEEYRQALAAKPDLPGVHYAVGRILWKMRRWGDAVPYLQKELQKNPHHALANYYLGSSYMFLENREEAIRCLERAVQAQPGLEHAHRDLGKALAKAGRFEEALASYRRVVEIDPKDPSAYALMSAAYQRLGKTEEARQAANEARRLRAKRNRPLQ
jgi:tetratricopeptide (TPR) repeat protein